MRFRYFIILLQIVLFCQIANGQKKNKADTGEAAMDDTKADPTSLAQARYQINDIKTNGIIIRLKTNKDRIAAYRRSGNTEVADKMEAKANITNLLLIYAFITKWTYSPFYFMESQNTSKLMREDTLVAKTFDLLRDTSIYMNHDSFYILDYGDLMASDYDGNHPKQITHESNNPIPGDFLVVKDHNQNQLQPPMPFEAKIWLEEFTSSAKIDPIELPQYLIDSMTSKINKYHTINQLMKSEARDITKAYLDSVFVHINYENKNINAAKKSGDKIEDGKFVSMSGGPTYTTSFSKGKAVNTNTESSNDKMIRGNPFQVSANRLNKSFISYYCKRLDKDRNILSRDDLEYWWQRNPNIQYLPSLLTLEMKLKAALSKDPKVTK
jgi:hypothetical protein